jgi:N-methylhydantoinase A
MRFATDAGGTFTDLVAFDEASGAIVVGKALTTPDDPSRGVLDAMRQAEAAGAAPAAVHFFVHGGTTVINAITERKGAATALVTTHGFRDVLAIGRGNRPDLYNLQAISPPPFVPRHLRFELRERIDASGAVRTPVDETALAAIGDRIAAAGVAAVAIAFLHAYANPAHEAAAAAFLRARLPGVAVTASHEISRQWREFERTNTAVLSAYVQPIVARYLANLERALRAAGIACPLDCMQSNGGLASFRAAERAPLTLVESGPAGGVAGAVRVGAALGERDLLYFDVGGTTAKCSLVRDGRPVLKPDYRLEWSRRDPGYPVQVPVVDIVEIGAGGGSIAWTDAQGRLHVGPQSAGADPGPACYARGGTAPTVTDAKLLTGVLDPERFAGGQFRLDVDRAAAAFAPLARHLNLPLVAAADAVIRLAEAGMINVLKLLTVQRGHDPRDLTLLAAGGGGPMHAAVLGRELGVRRVVVPRYAGLFSAWGMLAARPRLDLRRTQFAPVGPDTPALVARVFAELRAEAAAYFATDAAALHFAAAIDMRYAGQEHTVAVATAPEIANADNLLAAFHAAHEQAYTFSLPDTPAEMVTFHLTAERDAPQVTLPELPPTGTVDAARLGERPVYFGESGESLVTPLFDRATLPPGTCLPGPLLVQEPTATTLVLPGQALSVERHGLLVIEETG